MLISFLVLSAFVSFEKVLRKCIAFTMDQTEGSSDGKCYSAMPQILFCRKNNNLKRGQCWRLLKQTLKTKRQLLAELCPAPDYCNPDPF